MNLGSLSNTKDCLRAVRDLAGIGPCGCGSLLGDTGHMDDVEMIALLKQRGYTLGTIALREDGVFLWQVNETLMFRRDVADLASGACTLGDVIGRNDGQVFPDAPHHLSSYLLFQHRMFQELKDAEESQKRHRIEDLVKVANSRGFSINNLILELDSGGGVERIFRLLKAKGGTPGMGPVLCQGNKAEHHE